jgi:serine acetyltransferase
MLRRLESRFDPARDPGGGLLALIISDYLAYYVTTPTRARWGVNGSARRESPRRLALLFLPRLAGNPCLHATVLLRLAMAAPKVTLGLWRSLLLAKHSIDIQADIEVGPGLMFPHPHGITFGWGPRIGRNVTILHGVTIGGLVSREEDSHESPTIGDDVVIYMDSMVLGPITVGDGSVIAAGSWLDHDLAPGAVHRGRAELFRDRDRDR